jgi:hypothetical protein
MTVELASLGSKVSRITVAKYESTGFEVNWAKKFKVTTNSKHNHLIMPNVLKENFRLPNLQSLGFGYHLHSCQEGFLFNNWPLW